MSGFLDLDFNPVVREAKPLYLWLVRHNHIEQSPRSEKNPERYFDGPKAAWASIIIQARETKGIG